MGHDIVGKAKDNVALGMNFVADRDSAIQLGYNNPIFDIYSNGVNLRINSELQMNGNPGMV